LTNSTSEEKSLRLEVGLERGFYGGVTLLELAEKERNQEGNAEWEKGWQSKIIKASGSQRNKKNGRLKKSQRVYGG